jgi:hypothetical protein
MRYAPLPLLPDCPDYDRGRDPVVSEVRNKCGKFAHCSYSIIQQTKKKTHGSIQIDAINAWLAVRIKKRPMKEAVD